MSKARPRAPQRTGDVNLPLLRGQKRDPRLGKAGALTAFGKARQGLRAVRKLSQRSLRQKR